MVVFCRPAGVLEGCGGFEGVGCEMRERRTHC
jgi:hypothetical protein